MSGLAAEFLWEAPLVEAAKRLRQQGLTRIEAYTPYPVAALDDVLTRPRAILPGLVFLGGCFGLAAGFGLEWYSSVFLYPVNIGGRPLASWPALIPIAFEIGALGAVLAGFIGFMVLAKLPRPYQPVAAIPGFERATQDRFFLTIDDTDSRFDSARLHALLEEYAPCSVVPWQS